MRPDRSCSQVPPSAPLPPRSSLSCWQAAIRVRSMCWPGRWGPTYRATAITGLAGLAILLVALALLPLFRRWLQILPLGDQAARELGLHPRRCRTWLLSLSAVLTAAATLIVGPLSFVGLIAPHIAAMTTPPKPLNRALCAVAIGAALMTAADWLGRSIHFPYEIPAGVLAAFVGGPYFLWLLYRRHP